MANSPTIVLKGLNTYFNPLSQVPKGSLAVADNIVIDSDGEVKSRRGFELLPQLISATPGDRINKIFEYQSHLVIQYGSSKLAYFTGSVWQDYTGSYAPPDAATAKTKSVEANSNFYFTTITGIQKLDAYTGSSVGSPPTAAVAAGAPKALDLKGTVTGSTGFFNFNSALATTGDTHTTTIVTNLASTTGVLVGMYVTGSGFNLNTTVVSVDSATQVTLSQATTSTLVATPVTFSNGSSVAYRLVWGYKDANKNLIIGAPSQRAVVTNITGHGTNVSLTLTIPATITTNWFFQVYRSPQSVATSIEPNDECQLVYEAAPTAGEIIAKSITFTDSTPDALRGASLYTDPSQEGILQANEQPPLCEDFTLFRGCILYANTTQKQNINLTLLAVSGSSGVASGDTITIGATTYLADTAENPAASPPKFQVVTTGTPAQNITDTANSLVRVINQASVNTQYYAYYISAVSDLPGRMLLEAKVHNQAAFALTASAHGSAYSPTLPTSGTTIITVAENLKNGIYVSKQNVPEAVPLTNVFYAGSAAFEIKRIIALRDSVFIFKDDGIFRMLGQTPDNFYIDLFDNTSELLATESAVNLNNTIYALTNQGVISASETGISVVSRAIEGDLLTIFGADLDAVKNLSYGISYQSDRKYILGIISATGDITPTQQYVYNLFTNSWTRWTLAKNTGLVRPSNNKLYLSPVDANRINEERKNYNFTDFVDTSFDATLVSYSGNVVTLSSVTGIEVGDLLYETSLKNSVITVVDPGTNTVTVADLVIWVPGAVLIEKAINCVVQLQPQTGDNPQDLKQFSELELFFRRARFTSATLSFFSDLSQNIDSLPINGVGTNSWGLFPWGSTPWGGITQAIPIRTYVPLQKQRCSQLNIKLTHRVAYGDFILDGINLKIRVLSERTTR